LQVGNASSGATAQTFNIQGYLPNLVISNSPANEAAQLQNSTLGLLNVTVNTGTTLNANGFSFFQSGTTVTNNGSIVGSTTGSRFDFQGTAVQTYGGTGTFGTAGTPFSGTGVSIANTSGVTLNAPIVATRVNL